MRDVMGEEGTMDLRDLGEAIFWPMTEALFGEGSSKANAPHLFKAFEDIDNSFGKSPPALAQHSTRTPTS